MGECTHLRLRFVCIQNAVTEEGLNFIDSILESLLCDVVEEYSGVVCLNKAGIDVIRIDGDPLEDYVDTSE